MGSTLAQCISLVMVITSIIVDYQLLATMSNDVHFAIPEIPLALSAREVHGIYLSYETLEPAIKLAEARKVLESFKFQLAS